LPAGIGAFISPLIGTIAVTLNGGGGWNSFGAYIASGWLAESTGVLTIIPIFWVTVFKHSSIDLPVKKNVFEYFLFVSFIFITGQIVFGRAIGTTNYPLVYSLFPFLVWAVFRFGPIATLGTALTICCFSVWGSLNEGGPFVGRSSFETLVLLQTYCWFVMVTALVLIGAVTERVVSENKLKESNRLLDSVCRQRNVCQSRYFLRDTFDL
jgi:integral membrane sensor domain MASE1